MKFGAVNVGAVKVGAVKNGRCRLRLGRGVEEGDRFLQTLLCCTHTAELTKAKLMRGSYRAGTGLKTFEAVEKVGGWRACLRLSWGKGRSLEKLAAAMEVGRSLLVEWKEELKNEGI